MDTRDEILLQVAAKAAIVNDNGKVLIVREASSGKNNTIVGKWTLVGGRINPGENFFDGLRREVKEETSLDVEPLNPLYVGEWRPVIHGTQHQIVAIFMLCRSTSDEVRLSDEHDRYAWIAPGQRGEYPMISPDCIVVDSVKLANG